jgi:hypothetical protein
VIRDAGERPRQGASPWSWDSQSSANRLEMIMPVALAAAIASDRARVAT